jgi:hypothetical protein
MWRAAAIGFVSQNSVCADVRSLEVQAIEEIASSIMSCCGRSCTDGVLRP